MSERPTGIIRTLIPRHDDAENNGRAGYESAIKALEAEEIPAIYIALSAKPKVEVLHMCLLIQGKIEARLNIAGYKPGDASECWDGVVRQPACWAVCTGPVSRPSESLPKRGFQGFRYTPDLW
jgi:hypothetical protein